MNIPSDLPRQAYFITLCSYQSQPLFGQLTNGRIDLTEPGRIAEYCWLSIPDHDPHVQIDTHIVMPNHFHGILRLDLTTAHHPLSKLSLLSRPLSTILRSFKAAATRRVNHLHNTPGAHLWQPSYHARQIRSEPALRRFRQYIEDNPSMWLDDPLNPDGQRPAPFCPVPIS
jgi:REP element-mobilizing transposase RayT